MTEMTNEMQRELRDVRANFQTMANLIRNGYVRREMYPVPRMGMTFRTQVDLNYWYARNSFTSTTRLSAHDWHARLQSRYSLHKAVTKCMELARPVDWHQLLLEWPHVSDTDPSRLAYTRDERGGQDNRQVITTIGKYITRHFPTLASHHVRDITALFAADQCKLVHTTAEMIYHLSRGPHSCMRWNDNDVNEHPYRCYDPRLGWSMAVREEGGDTVARALVYTYPDGRKRFVRSYTKNNNFSHSDTILEAWMNSQGISKRGDWEGAHLARVTVGSYGRLLFPYIDGDIKDVDDCVNDDYLLVIDGGEYRCDNTDGTADESDLQTCADCGERAQADDGYWVGRHEDSWVCNSCHDDYYWAYGRRGTQYYLHSDNIVTVNDTPYDPDFLSDNNIVELHDGEYSHTDNAVYIESQDAYYDCDSSEICYTQDGCYELVDDCVCLENGKYVLEDEAWKCEHSDEWYHNNEDSVVTACGKTIHPDFADEYDMPEGYEPPEAKPVPAPAPVTPVAEVAAAPVPFPLNGGLTSTTASPSLGEIVYAQDGIEITKRQLVNDPRMVRYEAKKTVLGRELVCALNRQWWDIKHVWDIQHVAGVEERVITMLLAEIAHTERLLREEAVQRLNENINAQLNRHQAFFQRSMTDMVMYGQCYTSTTWDESAGVVFAAAPTL